MACRSRRFPSVFDCGTGIRLRARSPQLNNSEPGMTPAHPHPCIVVGVTEHQPPQVIRQAAGFARRFGATLVCAHVDADAYVVAEHPDGSVGHARSTLTCPNGTPPSSTAA
jgi:hypothetical protein